MIRRLILLTLIFTIAAAGCGGATPQLRHADTVPDDLRALADEAWLDFLDAIPVRLHCLSEPTLSAAWELDTRAEYQPDTETLLVRVPGTPATLRSELLHEFAHHVEFTCFDHGLLRPDFLAAQGFRTDAPWFEGDTWETTPSEQYAEAMVELVEGRRAYRGGIQLTDEAIAIVREWGQGP